MDAAEQWEPDEARASRPVLRARGGEIPPRDSLAAVPARSDLEREAGVEISRATMDGWVMHVGELLIPVREAMRQELLARSYLQADETTVMVQTREKKGVITKRIYGSLASQAAESCSNLRWGAAATWPPGSWGTGRGSCRPTLMWAMTKPEARDCATMAAGPLSRL